MISTTPHVAHARLSVRYHAPGATPTDQATIALMWQAIWGMIDAITYIGFFVVPIGLSLLGISIFGALSYFAGLIFYFVLGRKVYRLSKAP